MLEAFLTRKSPSPEDLKRLLPAVWWRGCPELTGEREHMRAAMGELSTAMARVGVSEEGREGGGARGR